jgi:hypothetical protein
LEIDIQKVEKYEAIYWPIRTMIFYIVMLAFWKLLFGWYNGIDGFWANVKNGFRLDASMVGGILLISWIPWLLFLVSGIKRLRDVILTINVIFWVTVCLVEFSSILMYREWGGPLDARAVSYLSSPKEAWATSAGFIKFWPTFWGLIILVSGWKRLMLHYDQWRPVRSYYIQSWTWALLVGPLAFLILRGGWGKWPITPSDAFYSGNMHKNFNAVNKTWYFMYSIVKDRDQKPKNSDTILDDFYKNEYQKQLEICSADTISSFQNKNIVLIVLEGWSADMVTYIQGKESIAPFFDSLASRSIKFDEIYGSGFRTDQGLASILSGIPSIHGFNFFNQLGKARKFPSLEKCLASLGYHSGFVYGGDPNFANFSNYLRYQGFDTLITKKQIDASEYSTQWGVPDHITAKIASDLGDRMEGKFFMTWLLLSSHIPFEVPIPNKWVGKDISTKYKSSVAYSDQALRMFFEYAQQKSWFKNTIFVITSDHGSNHSGIDNQSDSRYKVPFIIYDPSAEGHSMTIHTKGNHYDLPKTITSALDVSCKDFLYSRNLWDTCRTSMAYWSNDFLAKSVGNNDQKQANLLIDHVRRWYYNL